MKTSLARMILACLCLGLAAASWGRDRLGARMEKIYLELADSVVEVKYVQEWSYMTATRKYEGSACGLLVDAAGLVMFSGSVIEPPDFGRRGGMGLEKPKDYKIVFSDDAEFDADYVGMDEDSNTAFVRIREATAVARRSPVKFAGSAPAVGEEVLVVGLLPKRYTPNRKFQTARVNVEIRKPLHMFGTTMALTEYLGAPVATLDGKVVGVVGMEPNIEMDESALVSAALSYAGVGGLFGGFVIPAESFADLIADPPRDEQVKRGWLGVSLQALDEHTAEYLHVSGKAGVYITRVMKGSPAERAGILGEDVLIELDGRPLDVTRPEDLPVFSRMMRRKKPGEKVEFTLIREGKQRKLSVELGESPTSQRDAEKYKSAPLGMTIRELVLDDVLDQNLSDEEKGVVVQLAESGGAAEIAELYPGDVIRQLDGKPVESVGQFKEVYNALAAERKEEFLLLVLRGGIETKFLRLKPDWSEE